MHLQMRVPVVFLITTWIVVLLPNACLSHLKLSSAKECDRLSLDALYHEKYNHITEDILSDSMEFVTQFLKRTLDSLLEVMASLPGRESSSKEELDVYRKFDSVKRKFSKDIKDIRKNITDSWNAMLQINFQVMIGEKTSSLESLRHHFNLLTDMYKTVRRSLDASLAAVLSPVKAIVRDGHKSIVQLAKAQQLQNNKTEVEDEEKELQEIVTNITLSIVPSFLGKVTLLVLEKKVDLDEKVDFITGDGDSPFDDVYYSLLIMRARINSIIPPDLPQSRDKRDLARKGIYVYWADLATKMIVEKQSGRSYTTSIVDRQTKYSKLWSDPDELAEAAVQLMQIYP